MKQFLKFSLASALGVVIALVVLSLIWLLVLLGLASSTESTPKLQNNTLLKIELKGVLSDYAQEDPFSEVANELFGMDQAAKIGLDEILAAIKKAKNNENISGIYIESSSLQCGIASAQEIRKALSEFKESGKFIYAYANELFDQKEYYICSVADSLFLDPNGILHFAGMSATPVFLTEMLDKIGIEPEIFKVGTYKSAVEPLINKEMSKENREQTLSYLSGMWNNMLQEISADRNISVDKLNQLADRFMSLQPTKETVENGLIDDLFYPLEMMQFFADKLDSVKVKDLKMISVRALNKIPEKQTEFIKEKVAVLYAQGGISTEAPDGISSKKLVREIDKLRENESVKAVVLRVNSPGGSAFASEQIWYALGELKKEKPLVVSMGDYAASGGYYISCNADKIIAAPTTLTGSIGIFGLFFNVRELTEKIGLDFDMVKTNQHADFGDFSRKMTPAEKVLMQNSVERGYDLFVERCAQGRGMENHQIRLIGEGRVWTGEQALERKLVDELGYLDQAIDAAVELAELEKYRVVTYPEKKDFMTRVLESMNKNVSTRIIKNYLSEYFPGLQELTETKLEPGILARMPYNLIIQ
ncbi:MAG: signal peptide peptidase SppA [Bacteroidales bacterium]|jgi:protease-4|nr:signal peptide peptidase SppA [Bacteroidales bacterium]MDI9545334.1 signal peptide peptidase SppA [Bacteroidota bacterium]OQC02339.1 MAG: Protease 4 [Bacteroidetes bacterium ADurb.Bin090]MBP8982056.1 signal peptide peptidase SppA [Bacteroidales bacterium]NLV37841.1 signal peptide peptidase SppA [Bacteroidales bacterium]